MADRLVTLLVCATPIEARLMMNQLAVGGVRATLEAEATTGMVWHLSNAIGGVKVLVMEEDAQRAIEILNTASGFDSLNDATENSFDGEAESLRQPHGRESLAAIDEREGYSKSTADLVGGTYVKKWEEGDAEPEEGRFDEDELADDEHDAFEEPLTRREEDADRAFRSAVMGLLFWPLQIYVVWVILKVLVSDERLAAGKRKRAMIATAISIPFLLAWCFLMRMIFSR